MSITQGWREQKDCEPFSVNPGGLPGRGGSAVQLDLTQARQGTLWGGGRRGGSTVPTSVCSGEAFGAGGGGEAGMELWGAALNRRGVCLPGNVSVSSQPPRLHVGPAPPESSRRVQVSALPPGRPAEARVRRHASGPAQPDAFPTDPPPAPRPQGRDQGLSPGTLRADTGSWTGLGTRSVPGARWTWEHRWGEVNISGKSPREAGAATAAGGV